MNILLAGLSSIFALFAIGVAWFSYVNFPKTGDWVRLIPIAHRGLFDHDMNVPENSMMAFQKAIEAGYAIELDVWLTKDDEVVVFHDETLKRMTGIDLPLKSLTYNQTQLYSLLGTREMIPTLKQVLDLVAGRVPVYVEVKTAHLQKPSAIEPAVAKVLDEYIERYPGDGSGYFAVISFNPRSIEWYKKFRPHFVRGQSYDPVYMKDQSSQAQITRVANLAMDTRPSFLVYDHESVNPSVQSALSRTTTLVSYNVNSPTQKEHASRHAHNVIFERIRPKIG